MSKFVIVFTDELKQSAYEVLTSFLCQKFGPINDRIIQIFKNTFVIESDTATANSITTEIYKYEELFRRELEEEFTFAVIKVADNIYKTSDSRYEPSLSGVLSVQFWTWLVA